MADLLAPAKGKPVAAAPTCAHRGGRLGALGSAAERRVMAVDLAPLAAAKPPYGSPCNNCGYCCQRELCPLGYVLFGTWKGPCPAHKTTDAGFVCGLVANPQRYRPARAMARGRAALSKGALALIGSGVGCDALADGEQPDGSERARFRVFADKHRAETERAKIVWGVRDR